MEKEVSCINAKAIIEYVKAHRNGDCSALIDDLDPEIDSLQDPEAFLTDPNNWVSCTITIKLLERARLQIRDEMVAYKIARASIENASLGYIQKIPCYHRRFELLCRTPDCLFEIVQKAYDFIPFFAEILPLFDVERPVTLLQLL